MTEKCPNHDDFSVKIDLQGSPLPAPELPPLETAAQASEDQLVEHYIVRNKIPEKKAAILRRHARDLILRGYEIEITGDGSRLMAAEYSSDPRVEDKFHQLWQESPTPVERWNVTDEEAAKALAIANDQTMNRFAKENRFDDDTIETLNRVVNDGIDGRDTLGVSEDFRQLYVMRDEAPGERFLLWNCATENEREKRQNIGFPFAFPPEMPEDAKNWYQTIECEGKSPEQIQDEVTEALKPAEMPRRGIKLYPPGKFSPLNPGTMGDVESLETSVNTIPGTYRVTLEIPEIKDTPHEVDLNGEVYYQHKPQDLDIQFTYFDDGRPPEVKIEGKTYVLMVDNKDTRLADAPYFDIVRKVIRNEIFQYTDPDGDVVDYRREYCLNIDAGDFQPTDRVLIRTRDNVFGYVREDTVKPSLDEVGEAYDCEGLSAAECAKKIREETRFDNPAPQTPEEIGREIGAGILAILSAEYRKRDPQGGAGK